MTLATPAIWLACCAAAPALWPATSTCTSPPQAAAAVTVLSVAPLMVALSCSAITSTVMSDHLRFVLEFLDQGGHVGHLHAGAALGGFADLQGLQARGHVHAEVFGLDGVQRPFLRPSDLWQRDLARLAQAQVGGDDGGEGQAEGFPAPLPLAGHRWPFARGSNRKSTHLKSLTL